MLNLKESDTQKIFVTSDTHFGHNKEFVWKARGYASVQEHDEALIGIINSIVKSNDILFHLGDFCLNTSIERFEWIISQIQCQNIYLLHGNHNNPHEKQVYRKLVKEILGGWYSEESEVYPLRYKNIIYVGPLKEMILNGQYVVLMHYPLTIWNEMKHGAWMLCGHSHYSFPSTQATSLESKILDVGWDGHGKPWIMKEIADVMATKQIVKVDHHQ